MERKLKIKVTYLTYDDTGRDQYVATCMVSPDESLRSVALSVINKSMGKTKHNWLKETRDDQSIVFYLEGSDKDPMQGFGIGYGINKDGSIQFLNNYAPLHHNWTLSEIYELRDSEYIEGDKKGIIVATPDGLGAGGAEIALVLQAIIYISGVYGGLGAIGKILGFVRNKALLMKWEAMDLRGLHQIRHLLDAKSIWTTDEVKKRLSVSEQFAVNILSKLGYEISGNNWSLGQSQKSLAIRSQWLTKEKEIEERQRSILEDQALN